MTNENFIKVCNNLLSLGRFRAPKDTGNLAYNSLKMKYVNPKECHIEVDQKIAPYMVYTNEVWISPKWKGRKNPNENWWQDYFGLCCVQAEQIVKG